MSNIIELQNKLLEILPAKRYSHTLGVRYTCAALAMRYGYNIEKAQLAGLLHDCAKYMKSEQITEKCIEIGLPVSDFEKESPQLLHGKLGAYFAKEIYGVYDEEILTAIEFHTTGHPNMSLLEKILFVADYIEPGRAIVEGMIETREQAFIDINKTIILKIQSVINYLNSINKKVDKLSLETYKYYKEANSNESIKGND